MNRALEKLDAAVEELKKLDAPPPPWKGLAAWRTRMFIAATKKPVIASGPKSSRRPRRG